MPPRAADDVLPERAPEGAAAPRYQQVKDFITEGIAAGQWLPGDRLPSESELVQRFGLSRMTVNRALRELAEQGRVERVAGVGSFVAQGKAQSTLLHIANIGVEVRQRGHDYACRVLTLERVAAPVDAAALLDVRTGKSVFHAVCVHLEDGVPVQLEDRWVNPRLAPQFGAQDFSLIQPSEWLVRHVPYDQMEHVVDAVLPTPEQARLLDIPPSDPCLLLTRRTWLQGEPITAVRCLHPGARYRLGSRMQSDGKPVVG